MSVKKSEVQITTSEDEGQITYNARVTVGVIHRIPREQYEEGSKEDVVLRDKLSDSILRYLYDDLVDDIHSLAFVAKTHAKGTASVMRVAEIEAKIVRTLLGQDHRLN